MKRHYTGILFPNIIQVRTRKGLLQLRYLLEIPKFKDVREMHSDMRKPLLSMSKMIVGDIHSSSSGGGRSPAPDEEVTKR